MTLVAQNAIMALDARERLGLGAAGYGLLAAGFGLTAPFWFGAVAGVLLLPLVWSTFSDAKVAAVRKAADQDAA